MDLKKSLAAAKAAVSEFESMIIAAERLQQEALRDPSKGPEYLAAFKAAEKARHELPAARRAEAQAYRVMREEEEAQLIRCSRKATGRIVAAATRPQQGGVDVGARKRTEQLAMWGKGPAAQAAKD